ncbi:unnamed protein product [Spirodela intermedia]|uniref:RING-type E3 ubiquitin transferase n=1 Tax=Spirodela intermedia TaxID=51605 RepID=A0A7I8J4K1_SPIIN|nr:unnamed protein product [Spirodela intermedia]CAA6664990.1 unnamed protein product [Spirodela intermedia]
MALHRRRILWPDCEDENEVPCIPSSPPVLAAAPPVISSATLPNAVVDSQVTTPSYGILMPIGRRRLLVVGVSLFAFVTILLAYYVAFRWYYHRRRRHRARTATAALPPPPPRSESNGDLQQDLLAGAGEVEPYHVWYIRTAGLDEPTIGAISVCAYRRGEGLVEGTDCSICLGEFLDGEMLRLLPKCSHAFHIPCIDTWLRSRVNCPLCRAPSWPSCCNSPGSSHRRRAQFFLLSSGDFCNGCTVAGCRRG